MEKQQNTGNQKEAEKKKITSRQVVAVIGVVLLLLMYIVTLVSAFVDNSASGQWFRFCLFGTLAVPIVIWLYSWMYGRLTGKRSIGDPETNPEGKDAEGLSVEKTGSAFQKD